MTKTGGFNFGIYPVISEEYCMGRDILDVVKAVVKGGAGIIQLRQKDQSKKKLYYLGLKVRTITSDSNVKLIINDHIDLAMAIEADGVHLGQDDLPCHAARSLSDKLIIGVSTHNFDEIKQARKDGATYINIGPVFATNTKVLSMKPLGIDYLKQAIQTADMPFTVMGGINKSNIASVLECGAKNIAVVTAITQADDIEKTVREYNKIIAEYSR